MEHFSGTYYSCVSCGSGSTNCNVKIGEDGAIELHYHSRWMSKDEKKVIMNGKIVYILSPVYAIAELYCDGDEEERHSMTIVRLTEATPSDCTFGLRSTPFMSNCPQYNMLVDLMLLTSHPTLHLLELQQKDYPGIRIKYEPNWRDLPGVRQPKTVLMGYQKDVAFLPDLSFALTNALLSENPMPLTVYYNGETVGFDRESVPPTKIATDVVVIYDSTPQTWGPYANELDPCSCRLLTDAPHKEATSMLKRAFKRADATILKVNRFSTLFDPETGEDTPGKMGPDSATEIPSIYECALPDGKHVVYGFRQNKDPVVNQWPPPVVDQSALVKVTFVTEYGDCELGEMYIRWCDSSSPKILSSIGYTDIMRSISKYKMT